MPPDPIALEELRRLLGAAPAAPFVPGPDQPPPVVLLDLAAADEAVRGGAPVPELHTGLARVVVGISAGADQPDPAAHPAAAACDLVVPARGRDLDAVLATVGSRPIAATALVLLLRGSERRRVDEGLHAESAVYSALQAGPEMAAWRAGRPPRERAVAEEGAAVALERHGDRLAITLTRPHVRNALDARMRDQLTDAFRLVALDPTIAEVHLHGMGPSFCAGGDLDEFGSFPDVATAHLVRLQQSAGRAIHAVADRVTAHLHGACMGSGIELPAFAGAVLAHPATVIGLPEVSLGLVPGAGGTVSLPRRIGRHRTALLALTGRPIDAPTALAWGLVDALTPAPA
jgi:enoyl-CoA hydratase/carnithine racemase